MVYSLPAEAGDEGLRNEDGHYPFQLAELQAAGAYSAVAEYTEARSELAAGLSKKSATLRSATMQFHVAPCQPVTLRCGVWWGNAGWAEQKEDGCVLGRPSGSFIRSKPCLHPLPPSRRASHLPPGWRLRRCPTSWQ